MDPNLPDPNEPRPSEPVPSTGDLPPAMPAPVSSHSGTAVPDPGPRVRCHDPERRYRQYSGHPVGLAGAAQSDPLRNWPDTRRTYTELKRATA